MLSPTLREGLKAYAVGPKIRAIRLKKKMGLVELGRHTGLSPAMLSKSSGASSSRRCRRSCASRSCSASGSISSSPAVATSRPSASCDTRMAAVSGKA